MALVIKGQHGDLHVYTQGHVISGGHAYSPGGSGKARDHAVAYGRRRACAHTFLGAHALVEAAPVRLPVHQSHEGIFDEVEQDSPC